MKDNKRPALSLILCSRNDEYMGNSRWRLETTLNYVADQAEALGRTKEVEVLVADWGSEVPLRDVLRLTPAATGIVSFILIPPDLARSLQKDSPFPEVLALNAAARRARGKYIGRIDQDTLVGRRFLEVFFQFYEGKRQLAIPLHRALLYSNRRDIPYRFAVCCPGRHHVARLIRLLGRECAVRRFRDREFWTYGVGIWLIHSDLWRQCGGYDERYIYYNWMEVEMILRLRQKYTLIDLGKIVNCDFYHLEHRNPRGGTTRLDLGHSWNTFEQHNLDPNARALPFHPNSDAWGLAKFELDAASGLQASRIQANGSGRLVFAALVARTGMQMIVDEIYLLLVNATERARKALDAMRGEHPLAWPRILLELCARRRT